MLTYIRTGVATCPVPAALDDGVHRHHRLLLLHHLARLPARSTFTRHRGPIYFADLFTHTRTPPRARSPWHTTPRLDLFVNFSDGTLAPSAPRHLAKEVLPSTLSFPPSLELKTPPFGIDLVWLLTALLWFVRDRPRDRLLNYSTAERVERFLGAGRGIERRT
jgi:hypothetical protein